MAWIKFFCVSVSLLLLSACGGGGGGGAGPLSAPIISGLTYTPTSTTASLSSFTVSGSVTISTNFDLTTLKIVDSRGNTISNPITGATGFRNGTVKVPSATIAGNPAGLYTFTVSVIDVNGTESNKLVGQIDIKRATISADAGSDLAVYPNSYATLNGSATNQNGTQSTYQWTLLNQSPGSKGVLENSTNLNAKFTPSTTGVFELGLQVSDGISSSQVDKVRVSSIPVGNFSLGSSVTDLTLVQGPPDGFGAGNSYQYDNLGLTFVSIGPICNCVTGWMNYNGSLKPIMISSGWSTDGQSRISLTSTFDDVIRIQGTPIGFDQGGTYTFYYDNLRLTYVNVSLTTGLVVGWRNYNGSLILN